MSYKLQVQSPLYRVPALAQHPLATASHPEWPDVNRPGPSSHRVSLCSLREAPLEAGLHPGAELLRTPQFQRDIAKVDSSVRLGFQCKVLQMAGRGLITNRHLFLTLRGLESKIRVFPADTSKCLLWGTHVTPSGTVPWSAVWGLLTGSPWPRPSTEPNVWPVTATTGDRLVFQGSEGSVNRGPRPPLSAGTRGSEQGLSLPSNVTVTSAATCTKMGLWCRAGVPAVWHRPLCAVGAVPVAVFPEEPRESQRD